MKRIGNFVVALAVCACAAGAQAQVTIETVTVGNPGNAGELSGAGAGGYGPDRICGAVDYVYRIGKFEVTAGQYTAFLNAVAASDTYGLYSTYMDYDANPAYRGCNIKRSGSSGIYTYSVAADWANRPVNFVSWGDAARFANWLTNGQPTGAQDLTTTEDGSYYLNGATTEAALMAVTRKANARYVIPSEDEWYKAAYHKNDGITGNYWDYPTGSDSMPSNVNDANYYGGWGGPGNGTYSIGSPYYRTEVGAFANSPSPYGTFDQGGNVFEWNEAVRDEFGDGRRGLGGGSFSYEHGFMDLLASDHNNMSPVLLDDKPEGFRVAVVGDTDSDGVPDALDNCPTIANSDQSDLDNDGIGDACDPCTQGPGGVCIPTVSAWGAAVLTLLLLTAGTLVWGRRGTAVV